MKKLLPFLFLLAGAFSFAQSTIPGRLDASFQIGTGFEDNMDAIAVQPDGKIIVAGQGDTYQDVPIRRIVRLNADGSQDPAFQGPPLLIYENYDEIALQPDGKILTISTYAINVNSFDTYFRFKRLNPDGSLDTTFNEGGAGVVETPTSYIETMAVQPDGKIIIGGQFTHYNGVASKNIARLNADGTLDTSFVVGTGFNSSVHSLCLQPDGKVLVAGNFSLYNGVSSSKFIRLNTDGSKDTSFASATSSVGNMAVLPNGNIVVTGNFTQVSGVTRNKIAILNPDGSLFNDGVAPGGPTSASNDAILTMLALPDNKILVGGWFTQWGGQTVRHLIRLNPNGSRDMTFSPINGPSYMVWDMAQYPGNRYVISGGFTTYDSQSRKYIARINGLSNVPAPTGNTSQTVCGSGTLASLSVTVSSGSTLKWYDAPTDGNLLDDATPLVNGTTYYASQTEANNESATRLAVTVTLASQATPAFDPIGPFCSGASAGFTLPTISANGITGTWSPAYTATQTRTYTFTPAAGQCATATTLTVTINPNVTTTFTQVAAICSGGTLSALPTTSANGITGTWSPALNNLATTTYTFTPDSNQCATSATMTIAVNENMVPMFTQVAAICSGGTLSALPTTSANGITGTWSPALNNLATTTYTFTPDSNQCATSATMTITVNDNTVPTFAQVAAICSGGTLSALPTTSTNGISGTWSPALNNLATTTYTFTPDSGQCATSATMTITVNDNTVPTFTQVPAICSGATLSALPTTSANGITGTWSPALNNLATTTYTFTPDSNQCATSATMTIAVNDNTVPTFTQVAAICSGATLSALPTTSANGITGTWSPALNNLATTTYTFTPDSGQCTTSATMTITVNENTVPTFTQVAAICSGGTLPALPTTSANGITGTWSPALNNTATTTYTFTPDSGQCATSATMTIAVNNNTVPTFTQVAAICSGGTLSALPTTSANGITGTWSPALNNLATTAYTFTPSSNQCATSATMTITVNENTVPTFTQVAAICSGATLSALPTTSTNGISGTWSPALNNTATTTYTFTPDSGQCATSATMTITVNENTVPTFTQAAAICSGATLPALPTTSTNGISGTWSPALNNTATTTYTFTPDSGQCATSATMTITVNENTVPTFTQVAAICSGATLSALPTTSTNGITGTWSPALNNLATTTYTFTPSAGQCATTATMTIAVNALPNAEVTLANGVLTASESGADYEWYTCNGVLVSGQTSQSFAPSEVGDYYAVITSGGCSVTSSCISVPLSAIDVERMQAIRIYPNPAKDVLNIACEGELSQVEIFTMLGQKVLSHSTNAASTQIDVSNLPAGTFLVNVIAGGASKTFKMVKR